MGDERYLTQIARPAVWERLIIFLPVFDPRRASLSRGAQCVHAGSGTESDIGLNLYYRCSPAVWGKGIAAEAMRAAIGAAREHTTSRHIIARARPTNAPATRNRHVDSPLVSARGVRGSHCHPRGIPRRHRRHIRPFATASSVSEGPTRVLSVAANLVGAAVAVIADVVWSAVRTLTAANLGQSSTPISLSENVITAAAKDIALDGGALIAMATIVYLLGPANTRN